MSTKCIFYYSGVFRVLSMGDMHRKILNYNNIIHSIMKIKRFILYTYNVIIKYLFYLKN